jgi:hypothetical protein
MSAQFFISLHFLSIPNIETNLKCGKIMNQVKREILKLLNHSSIDLTHVAMFYQSASKWDQQLNPANITKRLIQKSKEKDNKDVF